ncbi:MAG: hypothetical protein A3F50_01385 [Candidatus Yanofskybacteria bacterium RIFCSPHIGHO2_12_FULL_44_29b]|nr:MAG: Small heat shock protein [Candidatus Yanofskybacteria bacterium GW2011_GWA2_44_10]OGN18434.1 MAG: hypothetical protein A3F50_01385 [Candidatus Yanofskybacteria bacterium RIFCSPHIGHO2_12_FULL_44_29b]
MLELDDNYEAQLTSKKETKPKQEGQLTVDVVETDDEIIIQSPVAGASSEDIDISVTQDMVTIRGLRHAEFERKTSKYHHQELFWGGFSRSIILPVDVDSDGAKAGVKNGLLTIRLPKLERIKTKKIKISG